MIRALRPLLREIKIAWYRWAQHDLQQKNLTHPDLPGIVVRLNELMDDRPVRVISRCAATPGVCCGDPSCEDQACPGLSWLHQVDGGVRVSGDDHVRLQAPRRVS